MLEELYEFKILFTVDYYIQKFKQNNTNNLYLSFFSFFIFMESLPIFEHEDKYRIGSIIILLFGMVLLLVFQEE